MDYSPQNAPGTVDRFHGCVVGDQDARGIAATLGATVLGNRLCPAMLPCQCERLPLCRRKTERIHPALQCRTGSADKNLMQHSNADSAVRAAAPKATNLLMPLAVLDHLPHLHGAEFKVLLVLGRHQAQNGGRDQKPFPYTISQIQEETGLCLRAISKAISRLEKHHLILRVKKHGALPNRYRVLLEPAAPQKILVAKKPARASKRSTPGKAIDVKVPELTSPPQKQTSGRRRKEPRPVVHVERANLFRDAGIDPNQPDQAKADPIEI